MDSGSEALTGKLYLAERLREVRRSLYGDQGGPKLARLIGVPTQSWTNYENGVTIPGEILLLFLVITGAEPQWLLCGEGDPYRPTREHPTTPPGWGARTNTPV